MFGKGIRLFTLVGFPIRIDPSWLLVVLLVTWSLAAGLAQIAFVRKHTDRDMFNILVQEAETSLHRFATTFSRNQPARLRLAFRELGLSIGLRALQMTRPRVAGDEEARTRWDRMLDLRDLSAHIEAFWSDLRHSPCSRWPPPIRRCRVDSPIREPGQVRPR